MFLKPSIIINLQTDLKDFANLCNEINYKPTEEQIKEFLNFLLILQHHSSTGTMTESYSVINNNQSEKFLIELFESYLKDTGVNEEFSFDQIGTALSSAKEKGGEAWKYLKYVFKKGKVKSSIGKELQLNNKILSTFIQLVNAKTELAKLEDGESPDFSKDIPSYI